MSGRRPMLQLTRPATVLRAERKARELREQQNTEATSAKTSSPSVSSSIVPPVQSLLCQYSESDDDSDEEEEHGQGNRQGDEVEARTRKDGTAEEQDDMDAELANFMNEINSLPATLNDVEDPGQVAAFPVGTNRRGANANEAIPDDRNVPPTGGPGTGSLVNNVSFATTASDVSLDKTVVDLTNTLLAQLEHLLAAGHVLPSLAPRMELLTKMRDELIFRIGDWKEGGYREGYFEKKCGELEGYLRVVAGQVSPTGWSYDWDEATQAYCFRHASTGIVSWVEPSSAYTAQLDTSASSSYPAEIDPMLAPPPPPPEEPSQPPPPGMEEYRSSEDEAKIRKEQSGTTSSIGRKRKKEGAGGSIKSKKMISLVQKWQSVDLEDSSDDEDAPSRWAEKQMQSGRGTEEDNANFTPVTGDWRERRKAKDERG